MFLPGESQGRGGWWAAVYGVAQSGTQLKRLSSRSSSSKLIKTVSGLCRINAQDSFRGPQPGSLSLYQNLGKSPPQTVNPLIDGKSLSFEGEVDLRQPKVIWASLVPQLPAVQETWVRSLGWEDPLEKEMAIHSSILAWKISWTEESGGLQSMGSQRVRHN